MKILYCTPQLSGSGGLERVISIKVNYLIQHGYDVVIVTTDQGSKPAFFELDPRTRCIDLGLYYKSDFNNPLWKRLWLKQTKQRIHKKRLKEILQKESPDIVISTFHEEIGLLPSIAKGVPLIAEIHGTKDGKQLERKTNTPQKILHKIYSLFDEAHAQKYQRLITLSKGEAQKWSNDIHCQVIPNPISLNRPSAEESASRENVVLAVGRLSDEKNFAELLYIWAEVAPKYPEWRLRIIGNGHLRDALIKQRKDLNLEHCTELLPATSDIAREYQKASVLAMTSRFEGFGLVLAEAMSFNVPTIAYDCPSGPRDIIDHGESGYLIPTFDRAHYVKCLDQLLGNEELRLQMGEVAQQRAKRYTVDSIMGQWINLFEDILKQ